jgi:hypothetical protein
MISARFHNRPRPFSSMETARLGGFMECAGLLAIGGGRRKDAEV